VYLDVVHWRLVCNGNRSSFGLDESTQVDMVLVTVPTNTAPGAIAQARRAQRRPRAPERRVRTSSGRSVRPDLTAQAIVAVGVDFVRRPAFDGEALFAAAEHNVESEVIELDTARNEGSPSAGDGPRPRR